MAKGVTMGGDEGGGEFVGEVFFQGWRIFFHRGGGFFGEKNGEVFLKVICIINQIPNPCEKNPPPLKKNFTKKSATPF